MLQKMAALGLVDHLLSSSTRTTCPGSRGTRGHAHPCAERDQDRRWSHPGCPPHQPLRRGWYQLCKKLKCLRSAAATAVLSRHNSLACQYLTLSQLWGFPGDTHLPETLWTPLSFVTPWATQLSSIRTPAASLPQGQRSRARGALVVLPPVLWPVKLLSCPGEAEGAGDSTQRDGRTCRVWLCWPSSG